jgi:hypothetical protein
MAYNDIIHKWRKEHEQKRIEDRIKEQKKIVKEFHLNEARKTLGLPLHPYH